MDYLQLHVMISVEYLAIICKKAMEKVGVEVIRETCCKEMEENKVKFFVTTIDEHAFQSVATRNARANFEYNWSTTTIKETGQHLHEDLQASWDAQGPKIIQITRFSRFTLTQWEARLQAKARLFARGHVKTRLLYTNE